MYRTVVMGKTSDESVETVYETEAEARAAFDELDRKGEPVNMHKKDTSRASGWRHIAGPWARWRGHRVHSRCVENASEAIDCGIDRGSCNDERCALKGE